MLFLLLFFLVTIGESREVNAPVNILASSNNTFVLPVLLQSFHKKYPAIKVVVRYGSSGDLSDAILDGSSYDVFLAADMKFAQKIYKAKKALNPPVEYAQGKLILFVPATKTLEQRKLEVLKDAKIKNIMIVNQKSSPYGMASIEVMKNAKLYNKLKDKIYYTQDITTAITNVIWYDSAGFLSKSAISALPIGYTKEGVNWIEVDEHLYSPIIQGYVLSHEGAQKEEVQKFIEFLLSTDGRAIYKAYGYE